MSQYDYSRTLKPGGFYDIGYNDPDSDPPRDEPSLVDQVNVAISQSPRMICSGELCSLIFDGDLSAEDKATVDTVVADHKEGAP